MTNRGPLPSTAIEEMIEHASMELMEVINVKCKVSSDPDFERMTQEIREMRHKLETTKELEKRIQRIFKEFDLSGMSRSLKGKADKEELQKDCAILDIKIGTASDQISFCRKDVDNLIALYKKLLASIGNSNPSDIG